jgi:cell filamentation protein
LRNVAGQKNLEIVRRLEHNSFLTGIDAAFQNLARIKRLSYRDVLATHKTLFEAVYPWAGQDRARTAPDKAVSRGNVFFAHPDDARAAVEHALRMGQDKTSMAAKAGAVMGYLAYGHPFLDGNGRAIMVVHTELAQRAGVGVDWAATDKARYLAALTKELKHPDRGILDAYLEPYIGPAIGRERLALHLAGLSGIAGNPKDPGGADEVLGTYSDPALRERYRLQQQQRGDAGRTEQGG